MRVTIVTARAAVGFDPDEPLLLAALEAAGATAEVAAWDDPGVDWAGTDLAVVRSAWDYAPRRDEFLAWARAVAAATRLANPAEVLEWTTDKTYLARLEQAGVPIVPTTWLVPDPEGRPLGAPGGPGGPGGAHGPDALDALLPTGDVVVKPTISAGARDTVRHPAALHAEAVRHAQALLRSGRSVMVQPYVDAVDTEGETALLYFGGAFSHAVRKKALLRPGEGPTEDMFAREELDAVEATPEQLAAADAVLRAQPFAVEDLAYARVDLVRGADGRQLLLELELAEPSVFLEQVPAAAPRFAEVLLRA